MEINVEMKDLQEHSRKIEELKKQLFSEIEKPSQFCLADLVLKVLTEEQKSNSGPYP